MSFSLNRLVRDSPADDSTLLYEATCTNVLSLGAWQHLVLSYQEKLDGSAHNGSVNDGAPNSGPDIRVLAGPFLRGKVTRTVRGRKECPDTHYTGRTKGEGSWMEMDRQREGRSKGK